MNKKNASILVVVVFAAVSAVLIAGVVFYSKRPALIDIPYVKHEMPKAEEDRPKPVAFEQEVKKEQYYTFDLEYPKQDAGLNEVNQYIVTTKEEFLNVVPKTAADAEYQGLGGDRVYSLGIKTKIYTSSTTITYVLESYQFTGGAHGGTSIATFTYRKDGDFIPFASVVTSQDALDKLSSAARNYFYEKLKDSSERAVIDAGTIPNEENFSAWYMTDTTITFVFQQYQIGPYVIGVQEFPLSLNEASSIL